MADGKMLSALVPTTIEALSCWHGLSSPMMLAMFLGFLFVTFAVVFMIPRSSQEPDPEQPAEPDRTEAADEPSTEPQPSRYPMDIRSLGCKFPSIFSDAMFRCEGVLIWMCHRCEERILRDNKPLLNTIRKDELTGMARMCMDGLTDEQSQHLKESLLAMTDLSDDDTSPRYNMTEEQVKNDIAQAFQAYQVGMNLFGHLRQPQRHAGGDESSEEEIAEQRYHRYLRASLDEVSDPAEWMEIHHQDDMSEDHETDDQRERRYMTSTRSEVSDVEYWEAMMGVYMGESEPEEETEERNE
eukprot:s164_g26.t1